MNNVNIFNDLKRTNYSTTEFANGNIRDCATINELTFWANFENLNSVFINDGLRQTERLKRLNKTAI